MNPGTVVLDFDNSVRGFEDCTRIDLSKWQEEIRFGCSWRRMGALREVVEAGTPSEHGTVLLGSGDFHHVTYLMLERVQTPEPFDLMVFDNHPDNMRYPFGIHCGSWVRWASQLPSVAHVHVVGITSSDVSRRHAWENNLLPLWRRRVTYWCLDVDTQWADGLGLASAFRRCADPDTLLDEFAREARHSSRPVYISIDKDVFSAEVAQTNWDQGRMSRSNLLDAISLFNGRLIGSDITGEISVYDYKTRWKRWLSLLDGQDAPPRSQVFAWQQEHLALNRALVLALDRARWREHNGNASAIRAP